MDAISEAANRKLIAAMRIRNCWQLRAAGYDIFRVTKKFQKRIWKINQIDLIVRRQFNRIASSLPHKY